jgi:hypothetical protein
MSIQFPSGVAVGYTFDFEDSYGGITTYIWDGQAWNAVINQTTGPKGEKGAKGAKGREFVYDDFTQDQLDGIKGEPFEFEDFTQEQLDQIKGEKGWKGEYGDPFEYDDFTDDQLTALKGEPGNVTFPSGTAMIFQQANPPIDWTVDDSYAEHALRVTSSSGFESGYGGSLNFLDAFKSHTVSGGGSGSTDNENVSGGGGSTTGAWVYGTVQMNNFGIDKMPGHQHNVNVYNGGGNLKWTSGSNYGPQDKGTTSTGSGGSHNHGWGNDSSHGHDYGGFSGSHRHNFDASFSSSINLSVKYANVIIGVKN